MRISSTIEKKTDQHLEVLIYMKDQVDTDRVSLNVLMEEEVNKSPLQLKSDVRQAVFSSLKHKAKNTQAPLIKYLARKKYEGQVSEYESFFLVNMIYTEAAKNIIDEIANRPDVEKIYYNEHIQLDDLETINPAQIADSDLTGWNLNRISVPEVWSNYNLDGSGVVIGIIDTGVDWKHPALQNSFRGYHHLEPSFDYNWFDPINDKPEPDDQYGHGTLVLGIATGLDQKNDKYIGIAPGAKWIAARGLDHLGSGSKRNLLSAGQFMLAPTDINGQNADPDKAPDMVMNSWGAQYGEDDWFKDMVTNWRNARILPLFAAGNSGPEDGSLFNPANYPKSFSVGAIAEDDLLADFSSRGPSIYGSFIKPDLVAPGAKIYSSLPDNSYEFARGTSMAVPHIAGTAALLLSLDPGLGLSELENILRYSAAPLTDTGYDSWPNYGYGYGLVNALKAVEYVNSDIWTVLEGPGIPVTLNETWRVNYNRAYQVEEIAGLAIDSNNTIIPVDIEYYPQEKMALASPAEPYLPGQEYELRIILNNQSRYIINFETTSNP